MNSILAKYLIRRKHTIRASACVWALILVIFLSGCIAPNPDTPPTDDTLTVYFIDVGQADSALLISGGKTMLIDGGNTDDSSLIYTFLKNRGIEHLDYMVATHAHEDHIGGLAGALSYATVGTAFCPVTEYDSYAFDVFTAYLSKQNAAVTVPKPGDIFSLGEAKAEILAPVNEYDEPNNTSIVLKVQYGDTAFLFTGDAERDAEMDILDREYDLSATVLKVGHHGSETSTSYPFLREIMPRYAVISCGNNNSYGHPHSNLLSRLRDAGATVFRTDLQGNITAVSDGKTVRFETERTIDPLTSPASASGSPHGEPAGYIGNKNSHVFHKTDCPNLPAEQNRVIFTSRETAIRAQYTPCGNCNP